MGLATPITKGNEMELTEKKTLLSANVRNDGLTDLLYNREMVNIAGEVMMRDIVRETKNNEDAKSEVASIQSDYPAPVEGGDTP